MGNPLLERQLQEVRTEREKMREKLAEALAVRDRLRAELGELEKHEQALARLNGGATAPAKPARRVQRKRPEPADMLGANKSGAIQVLTKRPRRVGPSIAARQNREKLLRWFARNPIAADVATSAIAKTAGLTTDAVATAARRAERDGLVTCRKERQGKTVRLLVTITDRGRAEIQREGYPDPTRRAARGIEAGKTPAPRPQAETVDLRQLVHEQLDDEGRAVMEIANRITGRAAVAAPPLMEVARELHALRAEGKAAEFGGLWKRAEPAT